MNAIVLLTAMTSVSGWGTPRSCPNGQCATYAAAPTVVTTAPTTYVQAAPVAYPAAYPTAAPVAVPALATAPASIWQFPRRFLSFRPMAANSLSTSWGFNRR